MTMRMQTRHHSTYLLAVLMTLAAWTAVAAEPPRKAEKARTKPAIETANPSGTTTSAGTAIGEGYCIAVRAQATANQMARDQVELQRLVSDVDTRIKELERKIADAQQWLAKRDAFAARARDSVVQIYSKMQPEAAAVQLAAISEETAAAVLLRLDAKLASALMAEMEPGKAARLASFLTHAGDASANHKGPTPTRAAGKLDDEVRR